MESWGEIRIFATRHTQSLVGLMTRQGRWKLIEEYIARDQIKAPHLRPAHVMVVGARTSRYYGEEERWKVSDKQTRVQVSVDLWA